MYLNLFIIKWKLLCILELVGVIQEVRELVLLGHHQLQAVVVVHSLVSGTFKYKRLADIVCNTPQQELSCDSVGSEQNYVVM